MQSRRLLQLVFTVAALSITGAQAQEKRRIAIYDFDYSAVHDMVVRDLGSGYNIGKIIASALLSPLTESGSFEVIDRARMQNIFKEQNMKFSDRFDPAQAIAYGKVLSVDAIVTGSVDSFSVEKIQKVKGVAGIGKKVGLVKATVGVTAQIISTETSQIYMAPRSLGEATEELSSETSGSGISIPGIHRGQPQSGGTGSATTRNSWEPTVRAAIDKAVDKIAKEMVAKAPGLPHRTITAARAASKYAEGAAARPSAAGSSTPAPKALKATVIDVSSGVVFIDKGNGAGIQKGDRFQIRRFLKSVANSQGKTIRLDRKVGELQITEVSDDFSSGTYSGETPASKGDTAVKE